MATVREELEIIDRHRAKPPVDVFALIEDLGIEFVEGALHPDISGMIEKTDSGYRIVVNQDDSRTRQRFTAAHELGHYMLHRPRIGTGIDDDRLYRSTAVGRYHNTAIGRREETQANKAAANILMPYDVVNRRKTEILVTSPNLTPSELARRMADEFEVSEHAMCIRLGIPYEKKPASPVWDDWMLTGRPALGTG